MYYNITCKEVYFIMHNKSYALKLIQEKQNGIIPILKLLL